MPTAKPGMGHNTDSVLGGGDFQQSFNFLSFAWFIKGRMLLLMPRNFMSYTTWLILMFLFSLFIYQFKNIQDRGDLQMLVIQDCFAYLI